MVDSAILFDGDGPLGLRFAASPTGRVVVRFPPEAGSQAAQRGVRYGDVLCAVGGTPLPRVLPPAPKGSSGASSACGGESESGEGDADAEDGEAVGEGAMGAMGALSADIKTLADVVAEVQRRRAERGRRAVTLGFVTPQGARQRLAAYGDAAPLPPPASERRRRRRRANALALLAALLALLAALVVAAARVGSGESLRRLGLPRESTASVKLRQLISSEDVIVSSCTLDEVQL